MSFATTQSLTVIESVFDISVSGRTITPAGSLTIKGVGYAPDTADGAVTLTGVANAYTYNLYAVVGDPTLYSIVIDDPANPNLDPSSSNCRLIGTVIDYPTYGTCQVLLSASLLSTVYLQVESDGLHIKAFGSTGASPYGQIVLESPGRTNDLSAYVDAQRATISDVQDLHFVSGGGYISFDGAATMQVEALRSLTLQAGQDGSGVHRTGLGGAHSGTLSVQAYQGGINITTLSSGTITVTGIAAVNITANATSTFQTNTGDFIIENTGSGQMQVRSTGSGVADFSANTGKATFGSTNGQQELYAGTNIVAAAGTSIVLRAGSTTNPAPASAGQFGAVGTDFLIGQTGSIILDATVAANTLPAAGAAGNITIKAKATSTWSTTAGNLTITSSGTGTLTLSTSSGGLSVTSGGAFTISGTATSTISTSSGDVDITSSAGNIAITGDVNGFFTTTTGHFVIQTIAAAQYVQFAADTTYFYDHSGATQYGYVNSAAMHHNTLVSAPTKAFIIPHPLIPGDVLSYAAVEMPEACVLHRGTATLDASGQAALVVPPYLSALIDITKITVFVSSIGASPFPCSYDPANHKFHGIANGTVSWVLIGLRLDIPPHPVVAPEPPGYDAGAFPYPARINAMRDTVGAAHLPLPKILQGGS